MYKVFLFLFVCLGTFSKLDLYAQLSPNQQTRANGKAINSAIGGSFFIHQQQYVASSGSIAEQLNGWLGLSSDYSFLQLEENTDELHFTHKSYTQWFKNVRIEDGMALVHEKTGNVLTINGRISVLPELFSVQPALEADKAIALAQREIPLLSESDAAATAAIELVILTIPSEKEKKYVLAYKIYKEGQTVSDVSFVRMFVFIDAQSGSLITTQSLIAHVSAQGTARTLYSGVQDIIIAGDSLSGYKLYDSVRSITTLNFDKVIRRSDGNIENALEYTNPGTFWDSLYSLDSISLTKAGDKDLFPATGKWQPVLKVLSNMNPQYPNQGPIMDLRPSGSSTAIFNNIGFSLTAPPYIFTMQASNSNNGRLSGFAFFVIDSSHRKEGIHAWSDSMGNEGYYTIRRRPNPALDAHWGMEKTYDFYLETFNRKSYDNRGGAIMSMVNAVTVYNTGKQNNAYSLGNGYMAFGLGDRYSFNDVVTLDVAGHEFSHMVITGNGRGGLVYQGESGALNESFADVFGTCIESYTKGDKANWLIGEEVSLLPPYFFRSLADPQLTRNAGTYEGKYWLDPRNVNVDKGGVHYNSGVHNKWFYLLCEGGSGTNDKKDAYQVNGIGIKKAQQIAYRNLMTYLTPYATYIDAFRGSLKATEDLYGIGGPEYQAVVDAWFAVGIGEQTSSVPESKAGKDLVFYPNPATDQLNIVSDLDKTTTVSLIDMLGRVVLEQEISRGVHPIDVRLLHKGLYLLQYQDAGKTNVKMVCIR